MNNTDNSPSEEQQLANIATEYGILLSITRPLIVTEHSLPSWRGGEICRSGFGISPGPGDQCPESILSRGEVFRSDESGPGIADDEEHAKTAEEAGTGSPLQIRICIGMS
jgi:hypothetical protein